jgi:hypothetical protein
MPRVDLERHSADGRDGVDDRQRTALVRNRPDRTDVAPRRRRGLGVHHRDELDPRVLVHVPLDVRRVDRVVVRHFELVQLGAEVLQPVAGSLPEDTLDEIEHLRTRLDQRARCRLESEDRLPLHQHDVVRRAEELLDPLLGPAEPRDEGGVVVVDDRVAKGGLDPRGRRDRAGGEGEVGVTHRFSFQRAPRTYGSARAGGR